MTRLRIDQTVGLWWRYGSLIVLVQWLALFVLDMSREEASSHENRYDGGRHASLFVQKPATEVYPFERRPTPERTRGRLTWSPDACSGCNLCVKDCPANALELIVVDRKAKRFVMRWHEDACIYCGQCVQVCRFDAIHLPPDEWELAATGREGFTKTFGNEDDIKQAMDALAERND